MIVHPKVKLRRLLRENNMSIQALATSVGMTRANTSLLVNGKHRITPRVALALERLEYGDAWEWIEAQARYDLWAARQEAK